MGRLWGDTATWQPATPLTPPCAPTSGYPGLRPKEQNGPRMIWSQVLVQCEFCQAPIDFVHRKLARNQTFTARCVPDMYLFGTFSPQMHPKSRPPVANFHRAQSVPGGLLNGSRGVFARTRRWSRGGGMWPLGSRQCH